MLNTKETENINTKVAQFKKIFQTTNFKSKHNMKIIFDQMINSYCQVVATSYLQSNNAKLIGCTPLHFAVDDMNSEAVDVLLSLGADYTVKNSTGSTALHQIIQDFDTEAYTLENASVNLILSAHIMYSNFENPLNNSGISHFHIACAANNVKAAQGFLHSGVAIDHTVKADCSLFPGFSPFHFAAKYCAYEVAEVLLSHGANIRTKDAKGMTPMHLALERKLNLMSDVDSDKVVEDRNEKILKLFLEKEGNDAMMIADDWGLSHLHVACTLNDSKIAGSYLQNVVNVNHAVNMDSLLSPGYTPLHFAALCNISTVKLLMKKGADMSLKDSKGVTPFEVCIGRCKTEDIYAILSLDPLWKNIVLSDGKTKLTDLVFAMRNPNQFELFLKKLSKSFRICNSPLWPGCSSMHLAVIFSTESSEETNVQILMNLCQQNPSILCSQDAHGCTPLHLAFRLNKKLALELLFLLYESHLNYLHNIADEDGLSYLHIASAENKVVSLRRLLSLGADVNAVYRGESLDSPVIHSGSTPLHFAVVNKSILALDELVKMGANAYAKDANDMTPIHLLLSNRNQQSADILLGKPHLQDSVVRNVGLSHLHVACLCGKPKHVQTLLNNGADINAVVTCESKEALGRCSFQKKYAGHSLLSVTFQSGYSIEIVRLLLARGADISVDNTQEISALYKTFELKFTIVSGTFVEILKKSADLLARMKADTGITELHVACFNYCYAGEIKKLISEGADVNARMRSDSPIFQGYTPLHVLVSVFECVGEDERNELVELFVNAGADVTLRTGKSQTVVHMAYKLYANSQSDLNCSLVNTLLEAQRDFSVNPASNDGISHFHVACSLCNTSIVEKFLGQCDIDVNQAIDYFSPIKPGYSPLHLAAGSQVHLCGAWKQLQTVDLLLKHGANVHAEDAHADTPLHECALIASLDIFERLVRSGANVNAKNVRCNTPLYCYIDSDKASVEGIKALLRFGCRLNVFNAADDEGYLGMTVHKLPYADTKNLLSAIIINFEQETKVNNQGRTLMHNIVSTDPPSISAHQYAELIERLSGVDCDIDSQDHIGKTALHVAAEFHNHKAITGLLMIGADINLADVNGKTTSASNSDVCELCEDYPDEHSNDSEDEDEGDEKKCEHLQTIEATAIHVKKLQLCGLDVSKQNEELACQAFEKLKEKTTWREEFLKELETIKSIAIGSHSLTLHDFLSETGAVADYPTMSQQKREDINKFFSPSKVQSLRKKFPEVAGILQLQYRKARARPQLVESAKNAMASLIGFHLPEICSHFIVILLKNSELTNLIASTI